MRPLAVIVSIALLLLTATAVGSTVYVWATVPSPAERTAEFKIEEDSAAWDCRTMGNKVCGQSERFEHYDEAFNCFAEIAYTEPKLPWNERVMRCIPPGK